MGNPGGVGSAGRWGPYIKIVLLKKQEERFSKVAICSSAFGVPVRASCFTMEDNMELNDVIPGHPLRAVYRFDTIPERLALFSEGLPMSMA